MSEVDRFYRHFEEVYRGDRQLILGRLEAYTDLLSPLLETSAGRRVTDLGCGRGEWLELTGRLGFDAHGIDLDEGMLESCSALGLSAERGEAIAHLRGLGDGSQAVVSAFHLVEHLPFEVLQELVQEALRVLEPGGLLVMETPNPENLRVASVDFRLDPTHLVPLPPALLSFLPRHYGFARAQVVRLQEDPRLRTGRVTLVDVVNGASPDYAVVAQAPADADVLARSDAAFAQKRGLTLEALARRFEAQLVTRAQLDEVRAELDALRTSTSWRVTEPLRAAGRAVRSRRR